MPIPEGQSCANCHFRVVHEGASRPRCHVGAPSRSRSLTGYPWPPVLDIWWCANWRDAGAPMAVEPTFGHASLRGTSDTGEVEAGPTTWTRIAPSFASPVILNNWTNPTSGQLQLAHGIGQPEDLFDVTIDGIVSFSSAENNQEIALGFGANGLIIPGSRVRGMQRQSDTITPIPVIGGWHVADGTTIELYVESSGPVTVHDYHFNCSSFGPIPNE